MIDTILNWFVLLLMTSPAIILCVGLYAIVFTKDNQHLHVCVANSVGVCKCGHNVVE